jgi:hypothetical protein
MRIDGRHIQFVSVEGMSVYGRYGKHPHHQEPDWGDAPTVYTRPVVVPAADDGERDRRVEEHFRRHTRVPAA